ncbi:hypothetical protein QN383_16780, partial [Pseudomonas sp. AA4]|uniref:hypothetical protein n=1 Tax=Pseudomonas sp. AA4 TaxID=3048645 RepID=UPI002B227E4B
ACKNVINSLAVLTCAVAKKTRPIAGSKKAIKSLQSELNHNIKIIRNQDYLSMIKNLNWHGYL